MASGAASPVKATKLPACREGERGTCGAKWPAPASRGRLLFPVGPGIAALTREPVVTGPVSGAHAAVEWSSYAQGEAEATGSETSAVQLVAGTDRRWSPPTGSHDRIAGEIVRGCHRDMSRGRSRLTG